MQNSKKGAQILFLCLSFTILFVGGFFLGFFVNSQRKISYILDSNTINTISKNHTSALDLDLYFEVLSKILNEYVYTEISTKDLVDGSIKGLVESLGDKYSTFYTPEETQELQKQNEGKFEGIGITLRYDGEYTYVESVIDDYPAFRSGILPHDIILEVDGLDMFRKRAPLVASKILGEKGTTVELKLFRESIQEIIEKKVTRDLVEFESIKVESLENNICHIKIYKFTDASSSAFNSLWAKKTDEIDKNNACNNGVILDLRGNPGGFVDSAIYVIDEFISQDKKILSEQDRQGGEVIRYSQRKGRFEKNPVIVLVNSGSASASEIVAGALQDYERGKILGEKTVGKGFEQKVISFNDGSSLHLVYKKWLTPNGHFLTQDNPIQPDIEVEYSQQDYDKNVDIAKNKAIEALLSDL